MASSRIPYTMEQGISKHVAGKIFQGTGNIQRDASILNFELATTLPW